MDGAEESVVLASFQNRHGAERMLRSLGHGFRKTARKGGHPVFVITGNADGSLKLAQSRVVTANGLASAVAGVAAATMAGLIGIRGALKGAQAEVHAARVHESHVGSDEQHAHAMLAQAGPNAAIALICCGDQKTRETVAARAAEHARDTWDGSREEFLAGLDPGSAHDWIRAALDEPLSTDR